MRHRRRNGICAPLCFNQPVVCCAFNWGTAQLLLADVGCARLPCREMIESGVIKTGDQAAESKCTLVYGQMNEPPGARARVALTGELYAAQAWFLCCCVVLPNELCVALSYTAEVPQHTQLSRLAPQASRLRNISVMRRGRTCCFSLTTFSGSHRCPRCYFPCRPYARHIIRLMVPKNLRALDVTGQGIWQWKLQRTDFAVR